MMKDRIRNECIYGMLGIASIGDKLGWIIDGFGCAREGVLVRG